MLLSVCGLRADGRRADEVRRVVCDTGVLADRDGSAEFHQGLTTVVASVQGPREVVYRSEAKHDRAIVRCQILVAPFSSTERKKRKSNDKRSAAIASMLEETFSAVIQTHLFQKSQIDITVHIVETDGNFLATAVNAVSLALLDAGVPMVDFVAACSAGFVEKTALTDLNYDEEATDCAALTVAVLAKSRRVVALKMTSQRTRISCDAVLALTESATRGATQIYSTVSARVLEKMKKLS